MPRCQEFWDNLCQIIQSVSLSTNTSNYFKSFVVDVFITSFPINVELEEAWVKFPINLILFPGWLLHSNLSLRCPNNILWSWSESRGCRSRRCIHVQTSGDWRKSFHFYKFCILFWLLWKKGVSNYWRTCGYGTFFLNVAGPNALALTM